MKTRTLPVLALVLAFVGSAMGGWVTSGDDIFTEEGNVAIGKRAEWFARLDVNAPKGGIGIRVVGTPNAMFRLQPNELNVRDFEFWDMEPQTAGLHIQANDDTKLFIRDDGNVGIGTMSPDAKLTLYGGGWNYLLNVGGVGNGKMKVRHIDGKADDSNDLDGLYLQYGVHKHTIMNAGGSTGNVGIGIMNPQAKLDVLDRIRISDSAGNPVLELGKGLDYAEGFDVSGGTDAEAGSVLVIDPANPGKLVLSQTAYDRKVAGIVAGAKGLGSGVRLGVGQFDCSVALAGRVYCNVDATQEAVEPGDLLTTAVTPGYAMKAVDYERARGATLGKAMEKLEKGKKGQILVLVTLQ